MTNDRRTVLGWAQPYPQPAKPTQPATPADSQLPPHLTYAPDEQPQGSQVAPLPPRVPPYAAYDQPQGDPARDPYASTQPAPDAYRASLARTQPAPMPGLPPQPPYAQPYAPQPYAQPYYDQQTVLETPGHHAFVQQQQSQQQPPASYPQSSGPYSQPYPSAQPYLQPQQPQPQFAPQPAFPSAPQAPFVRRKSPSAPQTTQPKLREKANATLGSSERLRFVRRTYLHLFLAILAFAGLEYLLVTNAFLIETISAPFTKFALGGRWNWGIVLGVFMVVSWVADYWARHASSRAMQYLGLGFYVIAEALIFVPLLAIVAAKTASIVARGGGEPHIIRDSALVTLALFGALTASVVLSRKDFSFLRSGLAMASAAALMVIVLSLVFGFNLGIVFSVAMVLLAAAYILYQTSQVLAHYDPQQHVAAALALFSSVALMFWYVIRIVMRARD